MALNWQAPAGGNFEDTFYNYLKAMEGPAPGTGDLVHLVSVNGKPTIGVGFDLVDGEKPVQNEVLLKMGVKLADIDLSEAQGNALLPGSPSETTPGWRRGAQSCAPTPEQQTSSTIGLFPRSSVRLGAIGQCTPISGQGPGEGKVPVR